MGYTFTPEVRAAYSRLMELSADLATGKFMPSAESLIKGKSTTVGDWGRVCRALDDIDKRLKDYAIEVRRVADKLPKTEPVRMPIP